MFLSRVGNNLCSTDRFQAPVLTAVLESLPRLIEDPSYLVNRSQASEGRGAPAS